MAAFDPQLRLVGKSHYSEIKYKRPASRSVAPSASESTFCKVSSLKSRDADGNSKVVGGDGEGSHRGMASATAACACAGHLGAAAAQPEQAIQPTQRTGHGVAQRHTARVAAVKWMAGCRLSFQLDQSDRTKRSIGSTSKRPSTVEPAFVAIRAVHGVSPSPQGSRQLKHVVRIRTVENKRLDANQKGRYR
ncbi:hypothetical protein PANT_11c00040 [Moesziomyces antarcticus T-34]|uniref:Uncharacterized protein n=1 Tax=Pseudozyma antarctica (strain T-34) TaxID=1151754 RepID=M9LW55_PSEA3|nr:hypothetical protein PANT_11c00040 [Moesziomyces antarcticus T-34]